MPAPRSVDRDSGEMGHSRVFISHTEELAREPDQLGSLFVAAAIKAVHRLGDAPVEMAAFPASPRVAARECCARVATCDAFVVLAGFGYGSVPRDRPERSYVELEYEAAGLCGLPRFAFLLDEGLRRADLPDTESDRRQRAFRDRLQQDGVTASFRSAAELETEVFHALAVRDEGKPRPPHVTVIKSSRMQFGDHNVQINGGDTDA